LNKTHGFLSFVQPLLNFINAIGQGFICQQAQAWQQAVKLSNPSFACSNCMRFCWLSFS
jgi:hypothetical protein